MMHLVEGVRAAVAERNWYAGLSLALTLPDICGYLEDGGATKSQPRSVKWFTQYAQPRWYTIGEQGQPGHHVILSGADCYALRCAYLHQGDVDISSQKARDVLTRFEFVTPDGAPIHLGRILDVLVLRVDSFCEEMCQAVEAWLTDVAQRQDVQDRINDLPTVRTIQSGAAFSLGSAGTIYVSTPPK